MEKTKLIASILTIHFLILLSDIIYAQDSGNLRKNDRLTILITGIPDDEIKQVSQTYTIDDQGEISLVHIGRVKVTGMSASSIARKIESAYKAAEIYTRPNISVTIDSVGIERLIYVNGEVKTPHGVPWASGMRLMDAISQCGDFGTFARKDKIKLIRENPDTKESVTYTLDVRKYTSDPSQNPLLQPRDRIQVPEK